MFAWIQRRYKHYKNEIRERKRLEYFITRTLERHPVLCFEDFLYMSDIRERVHKIQDTYLWTTFSESVMNRADYGEKISSRSIDFDEERHFWRGT